MSIYVSENFKTGGTIFDSERSLVSHITNISIQSKFATYYANLL